MAYTKQTWETGDTITAAKLNHMEDGIAEGDTLVYTGTYDSTKYTFEFPITGNELVTYLNQGKTIIFCGTYEYLYEEESITYNYCFRKSVVGYKTQTENNEITALYIDFGGTNYFDVISSFSENIIISPPMSS